MFSIKHAVLRKNTMNSLCTLNRLSKSTSVFGKFSWAEVVQNANLIGNLEKIHLRFLSPTAEDILKDQRFDNKTCLITGATSGIGKEMAKCLSVRGCDVIMPCRNSYVARAMATEYDLQDRLKFYYLNLASLKSVQECSKDILKNVKNIDMVILSAGIFGIPWTLTENNLETIFQVNFLSQYCLLMNIEPILAPNARVVFVTSESHRRVNWSDRDMIMPTEQMLSISQDVYTSIKAYNISKLCQLYAMHYLGYRWLNTERSVFCAHPGSFVKTNLCQHWWLWELLYAVMRPFAKTISQAAATPLYCATSPELYGLSAIFYKNCERHNESDLAINFHLALRIIELADDILADRLGKNPVIDKIPASASNNNYKIKEGMENVVF